MTLRFIWDEDKHRENRKKHGVSFQEAATVFSNRPLRIFHDPDHSEVEQRYIAVGFCSRGRLLVVVHCENRNGTVIRIISARKATRRERLSAFGEV